MTDPLTSYNFILFKGFVIYSNVSLIISLMTSTYIEIPTLGLRHESELTKNSLKWIRSTVEFFNVINFFDSSFVNTYDCN